MNTPTTMAAEEIADAELVARSLAGERDAFGQIVTRHQTLICSLAYNATGNLTQSEDLAQETFLAAWRELRQLREPEKLRAWLCGIARNTIHNRFRSLKREPVHGASGLEAAAEVPASEPLPSDLAVTHEREALLWRSLERIPEAYREPLILFYRQHKSVERVAADLGLSEEVVRQRLSRGRKLLQEQVERFVEGMLARTTPGVVFTTTVIGSLPLLASAGIASATSAGGMVAKTGLAAVGMKLLMAFNVVLGPLLGVVAGVVSIFASYKTVRTPRERASLKRYHKLLLLGFCVSMLVTVGLAVMAKGDPKLRPMVPVLSVGFTLTYAAFVAILAFRMKRGLKRMRLEGLQTHPDLLKNAADDPCGKFVEFRSKWVFLGLPLVHVRLGTPIDEKVKPAVGWIAVGDYAFGAIALGGLAVGGLSVGGLAAGLAAIGGVGVGGFAAGGIAVGALADGGVALGYVATGANAFGWLAAQGVYAVAHHFALGKHAVALHANDALAKAWFASHEWFDFRAGGGKAIVSLVWLPAVLPLVRYWRVWLPKRRRRTSS